MHSPGSTWLLPAVHRWETACCCPARVTGRTISMAEQRTSRRGAAELSTSNGPGVRSPAVPASAPGIEQRTVLSVPPGWQRALALPLILIAWLALVLVAGWLLGHVTKT